MRCTVLSTISTVKPSNIRAICTIMGKRIDDVRLRMRGTHSVRETIFLVMRENAENCHHRGGKRKKRRMKIKLNSFNVNLFTFSLPFVSGVYFYPLLMFDDPNSKEENVKSERRSIDRLTEKEEISFFSTRKMMMMNRRRQLVAGRNSTDRENRFQHRGFFRTDINLIIDRRQ